MRNFAVPCLIAAAFLMPGCLQPSHRTPVRPWAPTGATPTTTEPVTPSTLPPSATTTTSVPRKVSPLYKPQFDRTPPVVRIWLSAVSADPVIQVTGACRMLPRDGSPAKRLLKLDPSRTKLVPGGFKLGAETYKSSGVDIVPEGVVKVKVDGTAYTGTIRVLRAADSIAVIVVVDAETYLLGVLGGEMISSWPREALRAQAIAARTNVLYSNVGRVSAEWDATSTVEDQVYRGGGVIPAVAEAVRATRGQALLHNGMLFPSFFHSTCGGATETPGDALGKPEFDFIEAVPCAWCKASPYYRWRDFVSTDEVQKHMKAAGIRFTPPVRGIAAVPPQTGTDRAVRVDWTGGETIMSIVDFRRIIGRAAVKSGKFECQSVPAGFILTGRGFGHGAGLCQYGAKGLAEAGKNYKQILAHYYRNTTVGTLY